MIRRSRCQPGDRGRVSGDAAGIQRRTTPYEVVTLYFTCESAGTAVTHVIVALVTVVLELTALIKVCAEASGAKVETMKSARRRA